jgi:hypothetical protein
MLAGMKKISAHQKSQYKPTYKLKYNKKAIADRPRERKLI